MPVEVTLIDRRNFHLFQPLATWLTVHLFYLIGFANRLLVLIRWSFSFATHGRGARLIAGDDGR
jgi:NADH dehydrogenase